MRTLFLVTITLLFFSQCAEPTASEKNTLTGKWLRYIDGQNKEQEGFELFQGDSIHSVNRATIHYLNWKAHQDSLFIHAKSIGTSTTVLWTDTLVLINDTTLSLISFNVKGDFFYKSK